VGLFFQAFVRSPLEVSNYKCSLLQTSYWRRDQLRLDKLVQNSKETEMTDSFHGDMKFNIKRY